MDEGISFGAVCMFNDELQEHGGACTRAAFPESFSRWAEDFVFFCKVGGNVGYDGGP